MGAGWVSPRLVMGAWLAVCVVCASGAAAGQAASQQAGQNAVPAAGENTTPVAGAAANSATTPTVTPAVGQIASPVAGQVVPIAIVPVDGVQLTGGLQVSDGKAMIAVNGTITAGDKTTIVTLPHRGELHICATTKVSLTADRSVAANLEPGEEPGLMMALDHGALEANFATGKNSDVILTPDFRIVISGPGTAAVQVRLGDKGDTCVDNHGQDAPYVTVSNIFYGGVYRVQPDQRVMFQQGSLNTVVDREKESCGCPVEAVKSAPVAENAFPVAQSEGLAPLPAAPPNATKPGVVHAQATARLGYDGTKPSEAHASVRSATPVAPVPVAPAPVAKKHEGKTGMMRRIGRFFRGLFGG